MTITVYLYSLAPRSLRRFASTDTISCSFFEHTDSFSIFILKSDPVLPPHWHKCVRRAPIFSTDDHSEVNHSTTVQTASNTTPFQTQRGITQSKSPAAKLDLFRCASRWCPPETPGRPLMGSSNHWPDTLDQPLNFNLEYRKRLNRPAA